MLARAVVREGRKASDVIKESFVTAPSRLFKSRCDMNKVVGVGKDGREVDRTLKWHEKERERERFENDGLSFAFPPLGGATDHGEAWQIIQTGNELCRRGGKFCIRLHGARSVSDAFKLLCSDVMPLRHVTRVKLVPYSLLRMF